MLTSPGVARGGEESGEWSQAEENGVKLATEWQRGGDETLLSILFLVIHLYMFNASCREMDAKYTTFQDALRPLESAPDKT